MNRERVLELSINPDWLDVEGFRAWLANAENICDTHNAAL